MKRKLILLFSLILLAVPAWAGEILKASTPKESFHVLSKEEKIAPIIIKSECPDKPRRGHWEVRGFTADRVNEFLENNPEWEPFGIGGYSTVYLKRWVEE